MVWSRVTRFLVQAGHEGIAVDLPGDDETAGLSRYADLVVDAIGSRPEFVLVAGSLGRFNRAADLRAGAGPGTGAGQRDAP